MGPMNPAVKLTKYKKVSSMADVTDIDRKCECSSSSCDCDQINDTNSSMEDLLSDPVSEQAPTLILCSRNIAEMEDISVKCDEDDEDMECDEDLPTKSCAQNIAADEEANGSMDTENSNMTDCPSSPQPFRSGTLTRRSRRTCREQRLREHMAQTGGGQDDNTKNSSRDNVNDVIDVPENATASSSESSTPSSTPEVPQRSTHEMLLDVIDGKMSAASLPSQARLTPGRAKDCVKGGTIDSGVKGGTLDFGPLKGLCSIGGIGPRGGIRRHSVHSGYLTLPRMTGFVGLTLPDLKTRRKSESSPVTGGVSALLDLKFFKSDSSNQRASPNASRLSSSPPSPGTPMLGRPMTISYSSKFRNSIGRRRKSITSIENLFRSIRGFSSPTPAAVLEEAEEPEAAGSSSSAIINPNRTYKKQISFSSLPATFSEGSSASSSCHSSPVPTPKLNRKSSSDNTAQNKIEITLVREEVLVPFNFEEILQISETHVGCNRNSTLAMLKVSPSLNLI